MLPHIISEEGIRDAVKSYGAIPKDILKCMRESGMSLAEWAIEGTEPELPKDITKLSQDEVKVLYDEFSRWYGMLKQRKILADLELRAAGKIKKYVEAYLRLQFKTLKEAQDLNADERKLAVLVHQDYVHWDREEEFWEAMKVTLDERISVISHARDRVFREDRSRDNIGPGRRGAPGGDDFLGA